MGGEGSHGVRRVTFLAGGTISHEFICDLEERQLCFREGRPWGVGPYTALWSSPSLEERKLAEISREGDWLSPEYMRKKLGAGETEGLRRMLGERQVRQLRAARDESYALEDSWKSWDIAYESENNVRAAEGPCEMALSYRDGWWVDVRIDFSDEPPLLLPHWSCVSPRKPMMPLDKLYNWCNRKMRLNYG